MGWQRFYPGRVKPRACPSSVDPFAFFWHSLRIPFPFPFPFPPLTPALAPALSFALFPAPLA